MRSGMDTPLHHLLVSPRWETIRSLYLASTQPNSRLLLLLRSRQALQQSCSLQDTVAGSRIKVVEGNTVGQVEILVHLWASLSPCARHEQITRILRMTVHSQIRPMPIPVWSLGILEYPGQMSSDCTFDECRILLRCFWCAYRGNMSSRIQEEA